MNREAHMKTIGVLSLIGLISFGIAEYPRASAAIGLIVLLIAVYVAIYGQFANREESWNDRG